MIVRGSRLVLKGSGVVYKNKDALGTECPDGAEIDLSPAQVNAQNEAYQAFAQRRKEVTDQVGGMSDPVDEPVKGSGDWVDLVNAKPVKQVYTNKTIKLTYGDTCRVDGKVQEIGQLTTGETVLHVINPNQLGTECPTGAVYLAQG